MLLDLFSQNGSFCYRSLFSRFACFHFSGLVTALRNFSITKRLLWDVLALNRGLTNPRTSLALNNAFLTPS